jgi:hypothetical protein
MLGVIPPTKTNQAPEAKSAWETSVRRDALGRYVKGQNGCPPAKQFKPGKPQRWQPGQCGNPEGLSKSRAEFERAFLRCADAAGLAR